MNVKLLFPEGAETALRSIIIFDTSALISRLNLTPGTILVQGFAIPAFETARPRV
jgi:hypothetical protein